MSRDLFKVFTVTILIKNKCGATYLKQDNNWTRFVAKHKKIHTPKLNNNGVMCSCGVHYDL